MTSRVLTAALALAALAVDASLRPELALTLLALAIPAAATAALGAFGELVELPRRCRRLTSARVETALAAAALLLLVLAAAVRAHAPLGAPVPALGVSALVIALGLLAAQALVALLATRDRRAPRPRRAAAQPGEA